MRAAKKRTPTLLSPASAQAAAMKFSRSMSRDPMVRAADALADFAADLIARHDNQADEDNPIEEGESGRMRCGCTDCEGATEVLRLAGRLP